MTERGTVSFGSLNIGFHAVIIPHHNIHEHEGVLAMFLSKIHMHCFHGEVNDDLHLTGNLYSHEYIFHNDPDVDTAETIQVVRRATSIVRGNSEYNSFEADHVFVFTITGLLPKPCGDYTNEDGVSSNNNVNTNNNGGRNIYRNYRDSFNTIEKQCTSSKLIYSSVSAGTIDCSSSSCY